MEALIGVSAQAPYLQRLESLQCGRLALWDVLDSCYRPGSLDADIDEDSIVVNDFVSFYRMYPGIRSIFFNGAKAQQVYQKHVVPDLPERLRTLFAQRLPSTSPANARLTLAAKTQQWQVVYNHTICRS